MPSKVVEGPVGSVLDWHMLDLGSYGLFVLAALAVLLIPGPAVLYIVTRSIDQGRTAGYVSALGLGLGNSVHGVFAAFGLSALLASSAVAFSTVKYAGAAYLIFLGVRRLVINDERGEAHPDATSLKRIFWQGVVINALNPKSALFILAFVPQFIDPARGHVPLQVLLLGWTYAALGVVTDSCYATVAGGVRSLFRGGRGATATRYATGTIYIGLGVAAALSGGTKK